MALVEKEKSAPFDNGPIGPDGQYRDYAVLPQSERDKGFVRPVRKSYLHVGSPGPKFPLRMLTESEIEQFKGVGYVAYEKYLEEGSTGRYWTQAQLDAVKDCGAVTTMGQKLAETYARDPSYYGATFCCNCGKHLPVKEFVWIREGGGERTNEIVGS